MSRGIAQSPILNQLRRPLKLTWAGLIAERLVRAFWPFWTILAASASTLMLGLRDLLPVEVVWIAFVLAGLGLLVFAVLGALRFRVGRSLGGLPCQIGSKLIGLILFFASADGGRRGGGECFGCLFCGSRCFAEFLFRFRAGRFRVLGDLRRGRELIGCRDCLSVLSVRQFLRGRVDRCSRRYAP